jgi:hypothetical protein
MYILFNYIEEYLEELDNYKSRWFKKRFLRYTTHYVRGQIFTSIRILATVAINDDIILLQQDCGSLFGNTIDGKPSKEDQNVYNARDKIYETLDKWAEDNGWVVRAGRLSYEPPEQLTIKK